MDRLRWSALRVLGVLPVLVAICVWWLHVAAAQNAPGANPATNLWISSRSGGSLRFEWCVTESRSVTRSRRVGKAGANTVDAALLSGRSPPSGLPPIA